MARRVLHDPYFKQAKAEGYRARSAYKLKQIQERAGLIRPGNRVLDLGCAPGAWLQVAAEIVGAKGSVIGLDLQATAGGLPANCTALVGDICDIDPQLLLSAGPGGGGAFAVIISDLAPATTGHGDSERSIELCRGVLSLTGSLLKPGGHLAMKALEGGEYPELLKETRALFSRVRGFKPAASRSISREMYIIAQGCLPCSTC